MNSELTYVATCLFGLEKFVGEEIDALGYRRLHTMDGRVTFVGDEGAAARCNLWFRTAERLYVQLGAFRAETFTELFDGTVGLPWEDWIGCEDAFPVKGHSIKSKLFSVPDCQSIIKKAVVTRLQRKYALSRFAETGVKYQIEFFLFEDTVTLMIDTSGVPLHKRGYRPQAGDAPLRETLAAAMVRLSRPREDVLFWDPFCGSGTIPVEAALQMTNTAPGFHRAFAAESFPMFGRELFDRARQEALDLRRETAFEAYASDIDPKMAELAQSTCDRAGMGKYIKCFVRDARKIETGGRRGTVVCNPPYGERMMDLRSAQALYREIGRAWRALDRWQIYVICSDETFESHFGRRADKVRRLYNGMIRCNYYQFFRPTEQRSVHIHTNTKGKES